MMPCESDPMGRIRKLKGHVYLRLNKCCKSGRGIVDIDMVDFTARIAEKDDSVEGVTCEDVLDTENHYLCWKVV